MLHLLPLDYRRLCGLSWLGGDCSPNARPLWLLSWRCYGPRPWGHYLRGRLDTLRLLLELRCDLLLPALLSTLSRLALPSLPT